VLVLLVIALGAGFATLVFGPLPSYDAEPPQLEVPRDAARLERGRVLVGTVCRRCHVDPVTQQLGGRALVELSPELGSAYARNITLSTTVGVGSWTDGELALLLRTGVHGKTKHWVPPWMPRFPRIADDDLAAILAFMRSDHPWVVADEAQDIASIPSLRVKVHAWLDWPPATWSRLPIEAPARHDPVAYGRYLVDELLQCNGCHGPAWDAIALPPGEGYLGGGNPMFDINGKSIASANITFDVEHGIGGWSYAEFRRALVDGFGPDGQLVRWPMRRHQLLDDHAIEAIYAYLATVPPVSKPVRPADDYRIVGPRVDPGRHVFFTYGCHYCHGERGVGIADLRGADAAFTTDAEMIAFILDPEDTRPGTEMPAWRGVIPDDQIAAVVTYVRGRANE
jgi:mono/diheme cytochrome c family protein